MSLEELRFPIGRFKASTVVSAGEVESWINDIERLPRDLRSVVEPLSADQLETPYRRGGWSVRQVVHHLADSHLSSFMRFKWALTEDRPTIKPYFEELWAELPDSLSVPIETSLEILGPLHRRWVYLLRSLGQEDLEREFVHPESGVIRLDVNIGIYAWHGRHHLAQITSLAKREGWVVKRPDGRS
jgi:uncharacterized damage-inducible protein DinB